MALTGVIMLSSKEKALVHYRGRNFDTIAIKLDTLVDLVEIQIGFVDELCDTNRRGRTFLQGKSLRGKVVILIRFHPNLVQKKVLY